MPKDIETQTFNVRSMPISGTLVSVGFAGSKSEARRLIDQGGVKLDNQVVKEDIELEFVDTPKLLQVGKRKFKNVKAK